MSEKLDDRRSEDFETSKDILSGQRGHELFIAIVGPAGAGVGTAAIVLKDYFEDIEYDAHIIKASRLIKAEAKQFGIEIDEIQDQKTLQRVTKMQNIGDKLRHGGDFDRKEDHSAIARLVIQEIRKVRAREQGDDYDSTKQIIPDKKRRAYIIDSLRHPAEAMLLRQIYQDAFALVGVVCDPVIREKRIRLNFFDSKIQHLDETKKLVKEFLERDANAPEKFGQHVSDTFHEADYFVDNSESWNEDSHITEMNNELRRFTELLTHRKIVRPTLAETAMHHARSAQMRSACLSRQVGAALVDNKNNIVATGTNEVPRAGGGLYGKELSDKNHKDDRCVSRKDPCCSNNIQQNIIINELIDNFPEMISERNKDDVLKKIRSLNIGGLLEFSRAVHAEMDAIISASRSGIPSEECSLFVTTYPCHYCARHIVAAGIKEVQYIEPYPKSKAISLHSDSISTNYQKWKKLDWNETPSVLFRPFVGVAPRFYRRVFLKDRAYKDKVTGKQEIGAPDWGETFDVYRVPYTEMELKLGEGI